jgi:hypothetical protein
MKRLFAFAVAALLSSAAISQGQEVPPPPSDEPPATTPAPTQGTEPAPAPTPGAQPAPGTQPGSPPSVFDALDADRDGKVAQQEAQAHPTVAENFSKADANGDGALSKEEFDATFKSQ